MGMITTRNRVVFFARSLPGAGTETDSRPITRLAVARQVAWFFYSGRA